MLELADKKENMGDSVVEKEMGCTSDQIIEKLSQNRSWKFNAYIVSLIFIWSIEPAVVYLTSFAGLDPNPQNGDTWSCVSDLCEELVNSWNSSELYKIPCATKVTEDGSVELLLQPSDYKWEMERTSFSIDFNLFCDIGGNKAAKTLISSIYFAGALLALLTGIPIFDNIGRKRSAIIGILISVPVTICGVFCHDYYFLVVIRFIQGYGSSLSRTPMFILVQELLPSRLRNYSNCITATIWALGYGIAAAEGYFIHDWNYMFLAASLLMFVAALPVIFCVESPRYYLMTNNIDGAKESFKFLASLNNMNLDLDNIVITDSDKTKERQQTFFQQMRDMIAYPMLFIETCLQMILWFITAMSYYGFNFSWGSIIPDIYIGYVMAMVGELIVCLGLTPLVAWIGRRRTMMMLYGGAACCYLFAIPNVNLDVAGSWTLESVAFLVGIVFVTASFSGLHLWSAELAPTSHQGLVFGSASSAARMGSFLGPFIFFNLAPQLPKAAPLVGQAGLMVLCCVSSFLLVETENKDIALTGEDVVKRRQTCNQ